MSDFNPEFWGAAIRAAANQQGSAMTEKHSPPADLKERLRAIASNCEVDDLPRSANTLREAADRIAALEAQLAEAKTALVKISVTYEHLMRDIAKTALIAIQNKDPS